MSRPYHFLRSLRGIFTLLVGMVFLAVSVAPASAIPGAGPGGNLLTFQPSETRPALYNPFPAVGFDQRLNEQIPLDLTFTDEMGKPVQLRNYFDGKPVILSLAYYNCSMLCTLVLNGVVRALKPLNFSAGQEFNVLTVSFDAREKPPLAAEKRGAYLQAYDRPGAEHGWHFLTGDEDNIHKLTRAVGFRYQYDQRSNQFAHASGIVILTPQGKIAQYFYGIEYSPRDVRLGLVEASAGKIGSAVDQLLLLCFHYDPSTGTYGLIIMRIVQISALLTLLALGTYIFVMLRRERRQEMTGEGVSVLHPEKGYLR